MLERYYAILKGREKARYLKSKENGAFDELLEKARDMFHHCNLCEHRCNVDRSRQKGVCGVTKASIATHFMHYGEESFLIPSYTIFFSGCNFKCVYCQNWDISQRQAGLYIEPEKMAEYIEKAYERGAKNINWVGGEPTPNIPYILETLKNSNVNIPQIWNSNMYLTTEAMELLKGFVDVYLTDFKYGNDDCAFRLSKIRNYTNVVERNHEIAYEDAILVIRHLVLPGHVECCSKPIMEWISENVPDALVNIMDQYYPTYRAYEYEGLNRKISIDEYNEVYRYAKKLGINVIK